MDIFGGSISATDLTASVGASAQTTLTSLLPIVEVVVGLILAFIIAKWLISVFKHVGK